MQAATLQKFWYTLYPAVRRALQDGRRDAREERGRGVGGLRCRGPTSTQTASDLPVNLEHENGPDAPAPGPFFLERKRVLPPPKNRTPFFTEVLKLRKTRAHYITISTKSQQFFSATDGRPTTDIDPLLVPSGSFAPLPFEIVPRPRWAPSGVMLYCAPKGRVEQ